MLTAEIAMAQTVGFLLGQRQERAKRRMHLGPPACAVLLMHRLLADTEPGSNCLPGPTSRPSALDVQGLEHLDQLPKRGDRGKPTAGILAAGGARKLAYLICVRSHRVKVP